MKVFSALALGLALSFTAAHAAPNVRLTNDTHNSIRPRVAFTPDHDVVVVWQDDRFGNYEILWQKFDRSGNALSPVVRVTNTAATSARPDVSCDASGNSHVVWQEGDNVNAAGTVYFCKLDASGAKIVNDTVVYSSLAGDCRVAALPNGETNLAYQRRMPVDQDVYVRHATAAGVLNCEKHLSGTPNSYGKNPCIANTADGTAHVLWPDLDYFFNWYLGSSAVTTSCGGGGVSGNYVGTPTTPANDIAGSNEISSFVLGSNIYALSSGGSCRLTVGTGTCTQPSVAAETAEGWLAWRDTRDGNPEIYYARIVGCTNTSGDVRLTSATGTSQSPHIVTPKDGSGSWVCAWADDRDGNTEIYLTSRVLIEPPNPNAPTNLVVALTPSACPPTAGLTWTDASNNETGFEIEQQVDGGAWTQVATPGVNATSWTSGALAYGSTTAFRVRAVNGTYPSDWAGPGSVTPVGETRYLEGIVRATVVDRGENNSPTLQPLPRVRVSLMRNGQPVASSQPTDANGYYAIGVVTGIQCSDQLAIVLQNDDMRTEDRHMAAGDGCAFNGALTRSSPLPPAGNGDLTWPADVDGMSGDAVNAHYWIEKDFQEYWLNLYGLDASRRLPLSVVARYPVLNSYHSECPATSSLAVQYGDLYARFRSAVVHEFTHHIVYRQANGRLGSRDRNIPAPQGAAMDEALADYFTAAWSGNTEFFPRTAFNQVIPPLGPVALRNIDDGVKMRACDGVFASTGDAYLDAGALSGALWDWRTRLVQQRNVAGIQVDHAIFDAIADIALLSAATRTFVGFRQRLEASLLGQAYRDDLTDAFDEHNIRSPAHDDCPNRPQATQHISWTDPEGRHLPVTWTATADASWYRVYANEYATTAVGRGNLVADSLTTTAFTYVTPDTTSIVSFVVVTVGADGSELTASDETPLVTAVGPGDAPSAAAVAIRAWPNPARGAITIEFGARRTAPGALVVCDVAGRVVRRLAAPAAAGDGTWRASWDGTAADGRPAAPGIYLVRSLGAEPRSVRVVWMP